MKLRELLQQMLDVQKKIGASAPYICGGTPRDRYLGRLDNIADIDITTGDKTIDYLSQEFYNLLGRKYNVKKTTSTDGHSTIFLGSFKMDFSSNFNVPGIEQYLLKLGIKNPTDMQKEMFSRDFTCNALLLSFDLKNLIDPTHRGFKDIKDRVIRTCLDPQVTLTTNKNRVVRAIYLAAKLGFDVDPNIISYVRAHPEVAKVSTNKVMIEKLNEAFKRDADKASHLITQMGLWHEIPIPDSVYPYYEKYIKGSIVEKKAYFQGGGGVNEPTPGHPKYKAEKAIVVQPRFEEPFYRNYDLYNTEGVNGPAKYGPGAGWNHMDEFKSIKDFLDHQRKKLKNKYVAEDSWITEDNRKERENKMKLRADVLHELVKISSDDNADHMLPPKEHGTKIYDWKNSLYQNLKKYKSVKQYRKQHDKKYHADDVSHLDFPVDDQVTPIMGDSESFETPIKLGPAAGDIPNDGISPGSVGLGDSESYPASAQIGGYLDRYLSQPDQDDKPESTLDFGYDLTDSQPLGRGYEDEESDKLDELEKKYNPIPPHGLYGLPDGVDLPDEDLGDPTDLNPDYGTRGPESLMYEDKWNI